MSRRFSSTVAWIGSAVTVVLIACSQSSSPATTTTDQRLCTPGSYVYCLCQSGDNGTKLCHDDGNGFDQCLLPGSAPCPGGEVMTMDGGLVYVDAGIATSNDAGPNPADSCPGKAIALDSKSPVTLAGDTTNAKDDASGAPGPCAVGAQSPDEVYQLIPTANGVLTVKAQGSNGFDPNIYLRASCADATSQIACAAGGGGTDTFTANVLASGKYYLYVDGKTGSAGAYSLTLSLAPGKFCGDGTVDTGEACDDGNNIDGDGCSADCKSVNGDTSPVAAGASCPGQTVHVWGGATTVTGTGTTTTYPNTWKDTDSSCKKITNVNNAPDHVYAVTVHKTGTLTVSTQNATFNVELLARTICTDATTTTAAMCANVNTTNAAPYDETISFPVTSGTTYYAAVDGASVSAKGDYTIVFSLP
jgi:cysteine-rich repeat protein